MEIRRSREERQNQVSDQFLQYRCTHEYNEGWVSFVNNMDFSTYEEWGEKYGPYANPEAAKHWFTIHSFYEAVGQRIIDGSMELEKALSNNIDAMVVLFWEVSRPIFMEWRKRFNTPHHGKGVEYLYNEIIRVHPELTLPRDPERQRWMNDIKKRQQPETA